MIRRTAWTPERKTAKHPGFAVSVAACHALYGRTSGRNSRLVHLLAASAGDGRRMPGRLNDKCFDVRVDKPLVSRSCAERRPACRGDIVIEELLFLGAMAFVAGLIDSAVGGGGLIQIPALFNALPEVNTATLFGTNKFSSIFGTASAARSFMRRVRLPWALILPAAGCAFVFSFAGAAAVSLIPKEVMKPAVLVLLVGMAIYTLWKKDFGKLHKPAVIGQRERWLAALIGGAIGFYDGIFGPGTGSFLIFLFIPLFCLRFPARLGFGQVRQLCDQPGRAGVFCPGRPHPAEVCRAHGGLQRGRVAGGDTAGAARRGRFRTGIVPDVAGGPDRQICLRYVGRSLGHHAGWTGSDGQAKSILINGLVQQPRVKAAARPAREMRHGRANACDRRLSRQAI
jgi:hypothetical protein